MCISAKKILLLVLTLCFAINLAACSREYRSTSKADYQKYVSEVEDADKYMPKLDELGDYKIFLATRKTPQDSLFNTTNSVALIVQYDKSNFEIACNAIENKYSFVDKKTENVQDIEAHVDGYDFRIDSNSIYIVTYNDGTTNVTPKRMLLIGICEESYKIAYLYHWDIELDWIKDLDKFIAKRYVLE